MSLGDPALIVSLRSTCDCWTICADDRYLLGRIHLLRSTARAFSTLTALPTALLLREQRRDPGSVDEKAKASEGRREEEVEEDTATHKVSMTEHGIEREDTYICGSKKDIGASTTETVSL